MLGTYFYNSHLRTADIIIGNLFNNIFVRRLDSDKNVIQNQRVSITRAPKEKFLATLRSNLESIQITLPRITFSMLAIIPDPQRRINPLNKYVYQGADTAASEHNYAYQSLPYILSYEVAVWGRFTNDVYQIVEQIMPFFSPVFSVHVKTMSSLGNIERDVDIELSAISPEEEFEFGQDDTQTKASRMIMSFEMPYYFFGPVRTDGYVKKSIIHYYDSPDFDATLGNLESTTSNTLSTALEKTEHSSVPSTAGPEDDYSIEVEITTR